MCAEEEGEVKKHRWAELNTDTHMRTNFQSCKKRKHIQSQEENGTAVLVLAFSPNINLKSGSCRSAANISAAVIPDP